MNMIAKIFLLSCLLALFVGVTISLWPETTIDHAPGILCPESPIQGKAQQSTPFLSGDFMITPLAGFEIRALVLHRENYNSGRESDLSPVDLALGWGRMSDQSVIDKFDIDQRGRRYWWKVSAYPIPRREIEQSSANMHIIPANDEVRVALDEVVRGSIVTIHGSLVKITADGNWRWVSSTTRDDTGDGSCEVIWVESLHVDND